ncbi:hypothetical protein Q3G72_019211 [Acer saccharum]|nr:hypothetical protein Q3G72_019211 [Acer saccharum]
MGKKPVLFNETDDSGEADAKIGEEVEFDEEMDVEEDQVDGDSGPLLVVQCTFLTPRAEESDWLRNNVFQSTFKTDNRKAPKTVHVSTAAERREDNGDTEGSCLFFDGDKLLGRPWQYDRKVKHDGFLNTYSLRFNNTNIVLLPGKNPEKPKSPDSANLLSFARFETEMEEAETVFVLLNKEKAATVEIPQDAVPLLSNFPEVFPDELPEGLPPLRDIQH